MAENGAPRFVLIVEDHPLVAESLAACVRGCTGDIEVVVAESVEAALDTLGRRPAPQLILTDLTLPDARGTESVRRLCEAAPQTPLLVVTALDDPQLRGEAKQLGAAGYLIKNTAIQTLRDEIRAIVGPPSVSGGTQKTPTASRVLSPRQSLVLGELAAGRSNKEIARRMNISEETVRSHVKEIFGRLGVRNRTEAVVRFLQLGGFHDQSG